MEQLVSLNYLLGNLYINQKMNLHSRDHDKPVSEVGDMWPKITFYFWFI